MIESFEKIETLKGRLFLPGDKSISHRAVMFGSLAKGTSTVKNYLLSEDIFTTINCFKSLGCHIERKDDLLIIEGAGLFGLKEPKGNLDCGNSGTTARLITGILSAQSFGCTLVGDESLSKRPMKRIIEPLSMMGAKFQTTAAGTLPLTIKPGGKLIATNYQLPVASAQVKSAVLLAGLHLENPTRVTETLPSRNHTELMLGLDIEEKEKKKIITVSQENYPEPKEYFVPSDISTAAFFMVLATIIHGSELQLHNILLNETRTGVLKVLKMMGADIQVINEREVGGERSGSILIKGSELENVVIPVEMIPNIIDEIPILSVAGCIAEGSFKISGAKELRVKESDRISALCSNYKLLGFDVTENDDGFEISGQPNMKDCILDSFGDHRIAMAFAVYALSTEAKIEIKNFDCVSISNPDFLDQVKSITS